MVKIYFQEKWHIPDAIDKQHLQRCLDSLQKAMKGVLINCYNACLPIELDMSDLYEYFMFYIHLNLIIIGSHFF